VSSPRVGNHDSGERNLSRATIWLVAVRSLAVAHFPGETLVAALAQVSRLKSKENQTPKTDAAQLNGRNRADSHTRAKTTTKQQWNTRSSDPVTAPETRYATKKLAEPKQNQDGQLERTKTSLIQKLSARSSEQQKRRISGTTKEQDNFCIEN
jgi:hypothetical protein